MTRGRIFINYRRDDSRADSGRLYDRLVARFPERVFRDVASLEPGVEWQDAIARVLSQADACIVVIGKEWLTIADANGTRRLDNPLDTVRREIVTALERRMRVFPVLVGGAKMPAESDLPPDIQRLCGHSALEMTEQDWDDAFTKLVRAIETALRLRPAPEGGGRPSRMKWAFGGMGAAAAVIVLAYALNSPAHRASNVDNPPAANDAPVSVPERSSKPSATPQARPVSTDDSPAPEPANAAAVNAPAQHVESIADFTGTWNAVVTSVGQTLNETIELYRDRSLRIMLRGAVAGVGKWHINADGSVEVTNAANFLMNGVGFTCRWVLEGDEFGGRCDDRLRNAWRVALTRASDRLPEIPEIPRVDVSGLTQAERAAFVPVLAGMRCTCRCGLTVLVCLERDRTCQYSPGIAQNALANFLRVTRGT